MSTHPYPEHVLDAVEEALRDKLYEGALPVQLAETALQAIWDASRVDTLDELEELPKGTVLIDKDNSAVWLDEFYNHWEAANGATFIPSVMVVSDGAPLRVVYWGDCDA